MRTRRIIEPQDPAQLYTHYCGHIFNRASVVRYGIKHISALLDHIQYCEHGDLCRRCCFIYSGPLAPPYPNWPPNFRFLPYGSMQMPYTRKAPARFFFEVVFGRTPRTLIKRSCRNLQCVNLVHLRGIKGFHINFVESHIEKCAHGSACTMCCWKWTGRTIKPQPRRQPIFCDFHAGKKRMVFVRRYIIQNNFHIRLQPNEKIIMSCLDICCNPAHFIFTTQQAFAASAHAIFLERKRANAS